MCYEYHKANEQLSQGEVKMLSKLKERVRNFINNSSLHDRRVCTNEEKYFFNSLKDKTTHLPQDAIKEIEKHIAYLKNHGLDDKYDTRIESRVINDAITNINNVLIKYPELLPLDDIIYHSQHELDGWCSQEKADLIVNLIQEEKPEIAVEIGIYGGRSLVPVAATMKKNDYGVIYGIDAWSNIIATEYQIGDVNDEWWQKVDLNKIKKRFFEFIIKYDLYKQIKILEAPSRIVHTLFQSIDYLHIDGSHSLLHASEDVILYATKVRNGGIIVMDDVNWNTVTPAVTILESICKRLHSLKDKEGKDICIFYRKTL